MPLLNGVSGSGSPHGVLGTSGVDGSWRAGIPAQQPPHQLSPKYHGGYSHDPGPSNSNPSASRTMQSNGNSYGSGVHASISSLQAIPPYRGGPDSSSTQTNGGKNDVAVNGQAGGHSMQIRSPTQTSMPTTAASLMREGPRDFAVIKDVGDGSFGTVCLADWKSPLPSGTLLSPMQHPTTRPEYLGKRLVAIKKMKKPFNSWDECMKLKELKVSKGESGSERKAVLK